MLTSVTHKKLLKACLVQGNTIQLQVLRDRGFDKHGLGIFRPDRSPRVFPSVPVTLSHFRRNQVSPFAVWEQLACCPEPLRPCRFSRMANLHFSWSDSIHAALSSCLPCLQSSDDHHDNDQQEQFGARQRNGLSFVVPPPRARPDELEGLLADSDSPDAETLSLHSNIGDERRRKKRRKPRKGITLFGYNLFGKPPIHLPDSDDEDTASSRRSRTISTSTLDSDAAPLDASVLDEQAVARLAAATAAAEEEQRKAKEERRRLRRERRELKRMALAMAMNMHQQHGEGEFEGFPVRLSPACCSTC